MTGFQEQIVFLFLHVLITTISSVPITLSLSHSLINHLDQWIPHINITQVYAHLSIPIDPGLFRFL